MCFFCFFFFDSFKNILVYDRKKTDLVYYQEIGIQRLRNKSRKWFWHHGAKKLGGTMVPGAIWKIGTAATTFSKLASVLIFQMELVSHLFKIGTGANFYIGNSANFSNGIGATAF